MKYKRIQCSERKGFGHTWAEWTNTHKTKNNFLNATRSGGDSDYSKDDESNFVIFAFRIDDTCSAETESSSGISRGVQEVTSESSDCGTSPKKNFSRFSNCYIRSGLNRSKRVRSCLVKHGEEHSREDYC